ncbi:MAG: D-glycero-beta-D-manno-heptose 1-phosphate adenylyltransferase [Bacteroidales bacterium]|jgi:rfaE bifunctional protein nucleotidyltransferase chain/domain|nr:D-glycero-beta-D-manno-heptose 1-phosphate adenylyltransferase [Bacteroidales bacterium]
MTPLERLNSKIVGLNELQILLKTWKSAADKIIFTNGCFDIVHCGHIDYLSRAKALGNRLIIGVNSDNSVRKLKGDARPLQAERGRLMLLAAFEFVDAVILFDEPTPYNLIAAIKPDVLVKGSDYSEKEIVGYDIVQSYGGKVATIPYLEGFSTSKIIEKILQN